MSAPEVSSTRLYLGNLPDGVTKKDIEDHFAKHGHGRIVEIKLMTGFGFIEYENPLDARDVVPAFHGTELLGTRLTVQFARGNRPQDNQRMGQRAPPRPRRTPYRMDVSGLSTETSWQDLKDFARGSGQDVVYSEIGRARDGSGYVEFETAKDLREAVTKLDNSEFKGATVHCEENIGPPDMEEPRRDRYRSRSPAPGGGARRGYPPPPADDEYYRRGPPRGYSPRRDDYRRRSPPREYYPRERYGAGRSPPRGPPLDDGYGPPRARYPPEDGYDARGPPPPRRHDIDPYANGYAGRDYASPPARGRPRSPPRYDDAYARGGGGGGGRW